MTSRLSKFEEFARLARHDGVDVRPTLLRVLADFYVQTPTHTPEEEQHFVALALRLIEEVDEQTLAAVARRLATYHATPPAVLEKLGIVLATAPMHEPQAEPPAIETQAEPPAAASAPPARAQAGISEDDRAAAARFSEMFFRAASEARRAMLRELDALASAPPRAIPAQDAAAATQRLEAAALRGRPFEFVLELERVLAVPRGLAEAIIKDASGEPMLVAAKAVAMPIEVVQRILLLVNPLIGSSVRRVFELSALYEELPAQAALRLVMLWRHAAPPRPAEHQAVERAQPWRDPRDATASPAPSAQAPHTAQRAS
ncbi:MAG TPA: DUF2336 domain-containing protein [Xanthobacteraceae bacterium]|nr:DUF2336 domain-containing protein [Xanthobacteraceae bacterium]